MSGIRGALKGTNSDGSILSLNNSRLLRFPSAFLHQRSPPPLSQCGQPLYYPGLHKEASMTYDTNWEPSVLVAVLKQAAKGRGGEIHDPRTHFSATSIFFFLVLFHFSLLSRLRLGLAATSLTRTQLCKD